jgi:hypothetical protein
MRSRFKPVHLHLGTLIARELTSSLEAPLPDRVRDLLERLAESKAVK